MLLLFSCVFAVVSPRTCATAGDASCSLQNRPGRPMLTVETKMDGLQRLWSTPGVNFRQCEAAPALVQKRFEGLTLDIAPKTLPEKPQCLPGQVLIGNFTGGGYEFSCCTGEQCGGCRSSKDGKCQNCAAGYVMQSIPVLNRSKCFMCDDVPGFRDAQGRNCWDLEQQGLCSGSWPNSQQDLAFQGVRPSEACCACGGGSVYPTPIYMAFGGQALYFGQMVDETPQPIMSDAQQVDGSCNLASAGLHLLKNGRVQGQVKVSNATTLSCSTVSVEDPMRGIVSSQVYSVPVTRFSYGQQVLYFNAWGLGAVDPSQAVRKPQYTRTTTSTDEPDQPDEPVPELKLLKIPELSDFKLQCNPKCPWLTVSAEGDLSVHPQTKQPFPSELETQVKNFPGIPSCSCQVTASLGHQSSSTNFVAVQGRLWKAGRWSAGNIVARNTMEIPEVLLQEDLGPGLQWYNRSGHDLQLPVVEVLATGQRFAVSEALAPEILDVDCRAAAGTELRWSRSSGDVMMPGGQVAFNLDPASGKISGTPNIQFENAAQGRAELKIECKLALGGPLYNKVLPVAVLNITIQDDVCWVPTDISGTFLAHETLAVKLQSDCLKECRLRDDCAAAQFVASESLCRLMISESNDKRLLWNAQVLIRLNNCSEQHSALNFSSSEVQYLEGTFSPVNVYQGQASYSRPGSNPERQLLLVQGSHARAVQRPKCLDSGLWFLHINASDFEDGNSPPEFFGSVVACITDPNVLSKVFTLGETTFDFELQPAELQAPHGAPMPWQQGRLRLQVPSCQAPDMPKMIYGTVEQADFYSLDPCDCFGEAHADVAPVDENSNAEVPRNAEGYFNNGTVADQRIFSGPYTCEQSAEISHFDHLDLESCMEACKANTACRFYLFGEGSQSCSLFSACNYIQHVGLQLVKDLYGIPSNKSYCRVANPEKCWQNLRRRSMLSFTSSDLPRCLFQDQHEACDALQLLLGENGGPCARCQYIEVTSSFAENGLQKVPLPQTFPAASQIVVSCNYTSRMFARLQDGLEWQGPRDSASFTCVSGEWLGEDGPWKFLANFTCQRCLQLGTPSLQRLSKVSLPEVYFLEHRQVHVSYPFATPGCSSTTSFAASPLQSSGASGMYLTLGEDQVCQLSSDPQSTRWWINVTTNQLHLTDDALNDSTAWCLCDSSSSLHACPCATVVEPLQSFQLEDGDGMWRMSRGLIRSADGSQCLETNGAALKLSSCPQKPGHDQFQWYFDAGSCFFGFDLTNTAQKLWAVTLATSEPKVRLGNLAYSVERVATQQGFFEIWAVSSDPEAIYLALEKLPPCSEPQEGDIEIIPDSTGTKDQDGAYPPAVFQFLGAPHNGGRQLAVFNPKCTDKPYTVIVKSDGEKQRVYGSPAPFSSLNTYWNVDDLSRLVHTGASECVDWFAVVMECSTAIWFQLDFRPLWSSTRPELQTPLTSAPSQGLHWLDACEMSISVEVAVKHPNPNKDPQPLDLVVSDWDNLTPKEKVPYMRSPAIIITTKQPQNNQQILFTCLPGQAGAEDNDATPCITNAAMKVSDFWDMSSMYDQQYQTLLEQKTCAALMKESTQVDPKVAVDTAAGGMSMKTFMKIMGSQSYHATVFGDPHTSPFDYTGSDTNFGSRVGFLSLSPGGALWGLRCPEGAVLASEKPNMPYCLQIDAASEKMFFGFSDSISCPSGMAVSGWYNLPGSPVSKKQFGGPDNPTGLRLFCRPTPLLSSSCEQAITSYCQAGGVVVTVSFDSTHFKLGCCKVERRLGLDLTSKVRTHHSYEAFSGYFCPSAMDVTGALVYNRTSIPKLGEPQQTPQQLDFSLTWDRFKKAWELYQGNILLSSLPGDDLLPVTLNASGSAKFAATWIEPLPASWLVSGIPKPQSPFPKEKPKYPQLVSFKAKGPDYKEYCSPEVLQDPTAFEFSSMDETNPCYHTFNAKLADLEPAPKTPLPKGITEQAFWQCSQRSKRRKYMTDKTIANNAVTDSKVKAMQAEFSKISLDLDLAAAVIGMIPWGSFALPGMKGQEKADKAIEDAEIRLRKNAYAEAVQEAEQDVAKSFRKKMMNALKRLSSMASNTWKNMKKDPWLLKSGSAIKTAGSALKRRQFDKTNDYKSMLKKETPIPGAALKNLSDALLAQTVPELTGSYSADLESLADAEWKDCMPLQLGLSKVMCDLFCIEDAVRSGTTAVLESLQDSHDTLMTNLQKLLDYQTQYLLWAIGTVLHPQAAALALEDETMELLSGSELLQDLRQLKLQPGNGELDREILDWHKTAAGDLLFRVTGLIYNVSLDNWPHRKKLMRGMLKHFHLSFQQQLSKPSSGQKQMNGKLKLLRDQAVEHREMVTTVKELRMRPMHSVTLDLSDQVVWSSILESFLRSHEKHDIFTMLHMKALDQMGLAISMAQNFSHCAGADTAELREVWQRAQRSQEKSSEALLEAWSASVMTMEHLEVALKDQGFLEHLLENVALGSVEPSSQHCENLTLLAQEAYQRGVASVSAALQPLALQLGTFKVLTTYQEKELQHRRLDYVPAPERGQNGAAAQLQMLLQSMANPAEVAGGKLAARALNLLGKQLCPAPVECEEGMLLPTEGLMSLSLRGLVTCGHHKVMTKDAHLLLKNVTLQPEAVNEWVLSPLLL